MYLNVFFLKRGMRVFVFREYQFYQTLCNKTFLTFNFFQEKLSDMLINFGVILFLVLVGSNAYLNGNCFLSRHNKLDDEKNILRQDRNTSLILNTTVLIFLSYIIWLLLNRLNYWLILKLKVQNWTSSTPAYPAVWEKDSLYTPLTQL